MANFIDPEELKRETLVLALIPAAVTAILKIIQPADLFGGPFVNTIVIMVAFCFVQLFSGKENNGNAMATRLLIDFATIAGTILLGENNFLLTGPPNPDSISSCKYAYAGIMCTFATVRASVWILEYLKDAVIRK